MNSDTIIAYRSDYPTNHPFQTAVLNTTSTTAASWSFATTTGPVAITLPTQTAILGSMAPLDPNANNSLSIDFMGANSDGRNLSGRPYFNSSSFDNKPFRLRIIGKTHIVTAAGGATTVTPILYFGTSAVAASDVALFTPTALSVPLSHTADLNWVLESTLLWDSTSQILSGESWCNIGCWDITAAAVITSVYTARATASITTQQALSTLSFIPFIKLSTTAPTSSANTLVEYSLERA